MIYLDPMTLGPKSLIEAWFKYDSPKFMNQTQLSSLKMMCDWLVEPCLDYVMRKCDQFLLTLRMHLTMSFLKLLSCMMEHIRHH
jgi:hypothetical protein